MPGWREGCSEASSKVPAQHASAHRPHRRLSVRMSASLLNLAAVPGAAGQPGAAPGAAQGIAQQGANAAQAQGPLAGFEALLAAFFGDQGLTAQAGATGAPDQGPLALLAAGAKITDGKAAKPGDAAKP